MRFSIPGKGRFTLVLQEEDDQSIEAEVKKNPQLEIMKVLNLFCLSG
jgi:hypothetical protein